jgi:hypothetical protein
MPRFYRLRAFLLVAIPPSGLRTQLARGVREIDKALPSHAVGLKLYGNTREYFVGDRY